MSTYPPTGPTGLTSTINSYLFQEYADDAALQTFVNAYNQLSQDMLNWFNDVNLPIYSGLSGPLLDWVANGFFGIYRPVLSVDQVTSIAAYGTVQMGGLAYGQQKITINGQFIQVNDDIFQRVMTWHLYRGDGFLYSTSWLKRRVHRFLNGPNGISPYIDQTYDVSIAYSGSNVTITVPNNATGQVLQYAIADGILALPFAYTYTVVL